MKNPLRMTHFKECRLCFALKTYPQNLLLRKNALFFVSDSINLNNFHWVFHYYAISPSSSLFSFFSLNLITYISYLKSSEIEKRTKRKKNHTSKPRLNQKCVFYWKKEIEWHFENLIIIVLQWVTIHLSCNLAFTTIARCYIGMLLLQRLQFCFVSRRRVEKVSHTTAATPTKLKCK